MAPRRPPLSELLPRWLLGTVAWCLALLVLAVTVWLLAHALMSVISVTAAVVAAVLLTALLRPVCERLERLRLPDWAAALATMLLTLAALAGVGYLVVERALGQVDDLQSAVDRAAGDLRAWVLDSPLPVTRAGLEQSQQHLVDHLPKALPSPASGAMMAGEILGAIALGLFVWFFLLKDGPDMWRWFVTWMPRHRVATVDRVGRRAWDVLGSYMRGTTVIAFADAVGIGVAMALLGVPLATSLSCIVFIGAFVPIIGATISGGLAVIVTLVLLGPAQALILLGAVILVQQLEGNLLQPLVMGRALHLHPVTIVVAVAVGGLVGGVLGAVAAVPVTAIAYRVASDLRGSRPRPPAPDTPHGPEAAADA